VGAVLATVEHDVHGDAAAIAAMDVGTARVPRAGPKPEIRAPQPNPKVEVSAPQSNPKPEFPASKSNNELELGVDLTGESSHHHGSFTCGHVSSYQREVLLYPPPSMGGADLRY